MFVGKSSVLATGEFTTGFSHDASFTRSPLFASICVICGQFHCARTARCRHHPGRHEEWAIPIDNLMLNGCNRTVYIHSI